MTWDVNSSIVSGWCKPGSDVDDRTSSGKLFQTAVAAGTLKTRDWKTREHNLYGQPDVT